MDFNIEIKFSEEILVRGIMYELCVCDYRYYWHGMCDDMDAFIKECLVCQKTNRVLKKVATLTPIPVSPEVLGRIGVDFIGPFTPTPRGNHYIIITVTNAFAKWPEAGAIPDKTSLTVADFIYRLFCRHGCCKVQLSDCGTEFVNRTLDRLHELCGVERKLSSAAYEPQTNGQTERFNPMLVDS